MGYNVVFLILINYICCIDLFIMSIKVNMKMSLKFMFILCNFVNI